MWVEFLIQKSISLREERSKKKDIAEILGLDKYKAIDVTIRANSWEEAEEVIDRARKLGFVCETPMDRDSEKEGPFVYAVAMSQKDLKRHERLR